MTVTISTHAVPLEFKVGKYSPKDQDIFLGNYEQLLKDSNLLESREDLKKEILEKPDEDKDFPLKMNILGLYLAQGLQDVRLPCDVSNNLRNCLLGNDNRSFTKEEDDIINNFMEENPKCPNPFSELAVMLRRSRNSIRTRYKRCIKDGCPPIKGPFSHEETRLIMDEVYKRDKNAHRAENSLGEEFWISLGKKMGRTYDKVVRQRWLRVIAPTIVKYEEGVMDVDFSELVVNYCVENGIKYIQEADWSEISRYVNDHIYVRLSSESPSPKSGHLSCALERSDNLVSYICGNLL